MKIPNKIAIGLYVLMWPGLFIYLRFGARTRLLLVCGEEILLVRGVLGNESWGLPGGGLKRHELPQIGVLREAREEIGLRLKAEQLQSLGSQKVTMQHLTYLCHFFAASLTVKPHLRLQALEIAEARWFRVSDIPDLRVRTDVRCALELWAKQ